MSSLRGAFIAMCWLALTLHSASVSAYDPDNHWRTLKTENFRLHYPDELAVRAPEFARTAEAALAVLTERLAWRPKTPIDIVLSNDNDSANGFAQNVPYNLVGLNAVAPTDVSDLSDYNDWVYTLVAHEIAHIVHIDTVVGLPRIGNLLLGRWLVPNSVQPRWFTEGLATYFESILTHRGRVYSRYTEAVLRMQVLDGSIFKIGRLTGNPWKWPQGSAPYLIGGQFLHYIASRFGEEALREISFDYGGRLIPYAFNLSVQRATGHGYDELYDDFIKQLKAEAQTTQRDVEAYGRIEGEPISFKNQHTGPARFGANGSVYTVETPLSDHAHLVEITASGKRREITWVQSGTRIAVVPQQQKALASILDTYSIYRSRNDFYLIDLESGKKTQLTFGAKVYEPDFCGANDVVYVHNDGDHSVLQKIAWSSLSRGSLAEATTLADFGEGTQVWTPRCAPNGEYAVFAAIKDGQRDLFKVEFATREVTQLTSDDALDGGPSFTSDGLSVVFHSDRDGIFNIYSLDLQTLETRRLTRVLGGAFHPEVSPDNTSVVYRSLGALGFNLARLPLIATTSALPQAISREHVIHIERPDVPYTISDYQPWRSAWPRAWLPLLAQDPLGPTIGISTSGRDAVSRHTYNVQGWVGLVSGEPGFTASYHNFTFYPGVTLSASRSVEFAPYYVSDGEQVYPVEESVWGGRVSTTLPVLSRRDYEFGLRSSYALQHRGDPRMIKGNETFDLNLDGQGRFGSLQLSAYFTNVQSYLSSISPEEGITVDLSTRLESPYLGSNYNSWLVSGAIAGFVENPWWTRHVLTLQLSFGYGASDYGQRRLFYISGVPQRDPIYDLIFSRSFARSALRGFSRVAIAGNALLEAHAEYRFPLIDVEAGIDTLPLYFRTLHAALFVDSAAMADTPRQWADKARIYTSVGAELRMNLLFFYALPATLRLGYGHGLGRDSNQQQVFVALGSLF